MKLKKKRGTGTPDIFEMIALNVQLKNQYEGANVKFKIFPEGADVNTARPLATVWGKNEGGKANAEWKYDFIKGPNKPLMKKPKFIFTAESFGCANVQAAAIELSADYETVVYDTMGMILSNVECEVVCAGGTKQNQTTGKDGLIKISKIVPGDFDIIPKLKDDNGNATKMYIRYTVQRGDTLDSIVKDFFKGNLQRFENKIIPEQSTSASSVWKDTKNRDSGGICAKTNMEKEGKNARDKQVYPGETVYLPCKGIKIIV